MPPENSPELFRSGIIGKLSHRGSSIGSHAPEHRTAQRARGLPRSLPLLVAACLASASHIATGGDFQITGTDDEIRLVTPELEATIRQQGYVSGVAGRSFVDRQTGFRDSGFGLDIVDWIMEPGPDDEYRDQLDPELVYRYGNAWHGNTPKRAIEGPQICTKAGRIAAEVVRGRDFVAVRQQFQYKTAAPGRKTGSVWTQWLVFPAGQRYFVSMDRIDAVNSSDAMFLRIDMPGHIRHTRGDTFTEVYLSYLGQTNAPGGYKDGRIPSSAFFDDFPPDAKFNYRRDRLQAPPERFIRAYRVRDPQSGREGPWLAGMTLDPAVVHEAWCHQRGYVCLIEEFGGRPVQAGESFSAAFIVGWFDSIDEMHETYDRHKGHTGLEVTQTGWKLTR